MNPHAIAHLADSKDAFALTKNRLLLRLRVDKADALSEAALVYGQKYEFYLTQKEQPMLRRYEDELYAYYETILELQDVRLVYVFRLRESGKDFYFSEDGLTESYDFANSFYHCFSYAYVNENDLFPVVPWMEEKVFYQIFVDRFARGDFEKEDSYISGPWGKRPTPRSFSGGDLKGIASKLPYLESLGVDALYLTPIFLSISNHKYDIEDYYRIDPQFGSEEDLLHLVEKAHRRNMRVVLDAVFNHCSERSPMFQDVLRKGKDSPYYDWFIIRDLATKDYEMFAACDYMPKINTANPEARKFLIDIGVYYIEKFDIDGWRLDVSDEVSHAFWKEFRLAIKKAKKDAVLLGENWHNAQAYLQGDQFDGIMNYAFAKATLDAFAWKKISAKQYAEKLNAILMRNNDSANRMMLNLIDSHDTHRFLTEARGDRDALYAALACLMFFLGAPCLYYGTEKDLEGGYDPDSRRDFPWEYEDETTRELIQKLIRIKKERFAHTQIRIESEGDLLRMERFGEKKSTRLFVHLSSKKGKGPKAAPLLSHGYRGGEFAPLGFFVEERKGEE